MINSMVKMDLIAFLKTIYLGDRALKEIVVDCWNSEVKLQVDCISRVRGSEWNYYDKEDLTDGYIVFTGVTRFSIDPHGIIPNDLIGNITVESMGDGGKFKVSISVAAVDGAGAFTEAHISICANAVALEDSLHPGVRISA